MKTTTGLTIIIPVYNEPQAIKDCCQKLLDIMGKSKFDIQLIIVNDGSTDDTGNYLRTLSSDNILVLSHKQNIGYGGAIKTGIRSAKFDYVAISDADGTYPNHRIPEFFEEMIDKNFDMIVGSRTGGHVAIPLIRKPAKWILNQIANYLTGRRIPDLNSGLRIMKKDIVDKFNNILPSGFSFTTTITLAMLTTGMSVEFIPIDYHHRIGRSKIRPIYDTLNFLQLIIRTVLYFNPLKIFIPLSMFIFVIAFIAAFFIWYLTGHLAGDFFGTAFLSSVLLLAIGMLADLIDKRI